MRLPGLAVCALVIGLASLTGCKKAPEAGPGVAEVDVLDASKLRPAFETAPAETQGQVNTVMLAIGSSDFVGALSGLESLTNSPGVTDVQKKVATDLSLQIQKKIA